MRGRQDVSKRRAAQYPAPVAIGQKIGQVGPAAIDDLSVRITRRALEGSGKVVSQTVQVDPGSVSTLGPP